MATKWSFEGEYLQGCSCDYGCPCEFEAPPTRVFCEAVGAWRITQGSYGDLSLDGLALGFAARWPKALHLGNGTAALLFDQRASQQQRDALMQIATGQEGGNPFEIIVTTLTNVLPPHYVPFQFHIDGKNSSVQIGDIARLGMAPIKNPVTGTAEGVLVKHETGFLFKEAEVVAAAVCESKVEGLKFSWPDKAGFVAKIRYGN
jgi:hypothetical protein